MKEKVQNLPLLRQGQVNDDNYSILDTFLSFHTKQIWFCLSASPWPWASASFKGSYLVWTPFSFWFPFVDKRELITFLCLKLNSLLMASPTFLCLVHLVSFSISVFPFLCLEQRWWSASHFLTSTLQPLNLWTLLWYYSPCLVVFSSSSFPYRASHSSSWRLFKVAWCIASPRWLRFTFSYLSLLSLQTGGEPGIQSGFASDFSVAQLLWLECRFYSVTSSTSTWFYFNVPEKPAYASVVWRMFPVRSVQAAIQYSTETIQPYSALLLLISTVSLEIRSFCLFRLYLVPLRQMPRCYCCNYPETFKSIRTSLNT